MAIRFLLFLLLLVRLFLLVLRGRLHARRFFDGEAEKIMPSAFNEALNGPSR
jgi:hypothetical protein